MPQHPKVAPIDFSKGLDNVSENSPGYFKVINNVDLDKSGDGILRKGYHIVDSASYSSLWNTLNESRCYGVRNGNLVRVNSDYTYDTLLSNIGDNGVSFSEVDNTIYFNNEELSGKIVDDVVLDWGILQVTSGLAPIQSTLVETAGNLFAGTYVISITAVDSMGFESGTTVKEQITIEANKGISFTLPPKITTDTTFYKVYVSTHNGNTLYYHGLGLPSTSYLIASVDRAVVPLRAYGMNKPPIGHIVRYYDGRLYIAVDNYIYYTEKYQYEWVNLESNYIEYPSRIIDILPVDGGIWVASDALYYLTIDDEDRFNNSLKEHITMVKGSGVKISGSYIHLDNTPIGYKWLITTNLGIFILFNQGMTMNMTAQHLGIYQADSATSIFLQQDGMNRYLSILDKNDKETNMAMGDIVETRIIRNGVTLPS